MLVEIGAGFILLILILFIGENWLGRHGPPGPTKIPFLGTLVQVVLSDPVSYIGLDKLSTRYGPIMSIKLGLLDAVVVSTYEAMKELSTKEETLGRHSDGMLWDRNFQQNLGIAFANGKPWEDMRKWCRETFKKYGFLNRNSMELLIHEELSCLMAEIESDMSRSPDSVVLFEDSYFHISFGNLISSLVTGTRTSHDDLELQDLMRHNNDFVTNGVFGTGLLAAYPFLKYIIPGLLGYKAQIKAVNGIHAHAKNLMESRRALGFDKYPQCFADDFLNKIDEDALKPNPFFTVEQFMVVYSDILQAGSGTSSSAVNFALLHLLCNPKVQDKMYHEIVQVCGTEVYPNLANRPRMPYAQAVILEGQRWGRTTVLGVPKQITRDFRFRSYKFKKGTVLLHNLHSIFFDQKFWGDPDKFRPERFLDDSGNLIPKMTERIVTFGLGKRSCFGEVIARDSSFLYLTTLIQNFSFDLEPGKEIPSVEPVLGMTMDPRSYRAVVGLRKKI